MNYDFPRIITLLRNERNLTQKQAAESLGITQAVLSHYERGFRECGLDFVVRVADFYEVSADYLLGRTADRHGAQLTVDDIPSSDGTSDDTRYQGSVIPTLNKKLIFNSINILFNLLQKADCKHLTAEVSGFLMLAVYKMFRRVYAANPKNPEKFFSVQSGMAQGAASAAMSLAEAHVSCIAEGRPSLGMDKIADPGVLVLDEETLAAVYPGFAQSLLTLIRNAEGRMKG